MLHSNNTSMVIIFDSLLDHEIPKLSINCIKGYDYTKYIYLHIMVIYLLQLKSNEDIYNIYNS